MEVDKSIYRNISTRLTFIKTWLILFLICFVVRLPIFLSNNFNFDGDEAIIGIMAQDFLNGKQFPIYFLGQNYGFSTFEVLSTVIFEFLIGPSIWTLRLGALFLFSLGLTFVYQTFSALKLPVLWKVILILLFATFPTWYLWGSMVRGGYLTAFVFSCILFYLINHPTKKWMKLALIGTSIGIIFESQVFILLGMIPLLLVWYLNSSKRLKTGSVIAFFFLATISIIRLVGHIDNASWNAPKMNFGWIQTTYLDVQSKGIIPGFSDFFYYGMDIEQPLWWNILLKLFISIGIIYLVWICLKGNQKKRKIFFISIIGTIAVSAFLISTVRLYSPRYWMGLFTGFLFWIIYCFIENRNLLISKGVLFILTLISVIGISVGNLMKADWYVANVNEMKAFYEFHAEVKRIGAKAIYITDPLIQWKWNYLFGKEIPASSFYNEDRTNEYIQAVQQIYKNTPNRVVIGGLYGMCLKMDEIPEFGKYLYKVNAKYFVNPIIRTEYIERAREVVNK